MHIPTRLHWPLRWLVLATLYAGSGYISLTFSPHPEGIITPVIFVAEAFSLAAAVLWGRTAWPGVFTGQLALALFNHVPLLAAIAIAGINSLELVLAVYLFSKVKINIPLINRKDLTKLVLIVVCLLQPFSSILGVMALSIFGAESVHEGIFKSIFEWHYGNSIAQVLLTPLIIELFYSYKGENSIRSIILNSFKNFAILFIFILFYRFFAAQSYYFLSLTFVVIFIAAIYTTLIVKVLLLLYINFGSFYIYPGAVSGINTVYIYPGAVSGINTVKESVFDIFLVYFLVSMIALYAHFLISEYKKNIVDLQELESNHTTYWAKLSHELRTPLNGIIGILYLLKKSNLDTKQKTDLSVIENSANYILKLTQDVLTYGKNELSSEDNQLSSFNLQHVIDGLYPQFEEISKQKGIRLIVEDIESPVRPLLIRSNRTAVQQILINLIGNAIKFTDQGEVRVKTSCKPHSNSGHTFLLVFQIIDTGIGIPELSINKLFQPFSQVSTGIDSKYPGTGLGLAIVAQLCKKMGGDYAVQSKFHAGSIFTVTIPCELGDPASVSLDALADNDTSRHIAVLSQDPAVKSQCATCVTSLGWEQVVFPSIESLRAGLTSRQSKIEMPDLLVIDEALISPYPEVRLQSLRDLSECTNGVPMLLHVAHTLDAMSLASLQTEGVATACLPSSQWSAARIAQEFDRLLQPPESRPSRLVADQAYYDLPDIRVLVVDDSQVNLDVCRRILEETGAKVTCFADSQAALDALTLSPQDYDIVLLDIRMPNLDGLELARRIRQLGLSSLPLIALSAGGSSVDQKEAIEAGMNAFISKPIDPSALIEGLREHLALAQGKTVKRILKARAKLLDLPLEWPTIPGLHLDKVRPRLANDRDLLLKLIKGFCADGAEMLTLAHTALQRGDKAKTLHELHKFRGEASLVGANDLARQAHYLEQLFSNEHLDTRPLQTLQEDLGSLSERLQAWEVAYKIQPEQAADRRSGDRVAFGDVQRLVHALSRQSIDALTLFETLSVHLKKDLPESEWISLQEAMADLDFPTALRVVQSWQHQLAAWPVA